MNNKAIGERGGRLAVLQTVHPHMTPSFDPYLKWLGIRDVARPPNHYRLLGIDLFETDPNVIATAADRQMAHVRTFQTGPHAELSQRVLNELAAARVCLLRAEKKGTYDAALKAELAAGSMPPPAPGIPPPLAAPPIASRHSARGTSPAEFPDFAAMSGGARPRPVARRRRVQRWASAGVVLGALAGVAIWQGWLGPWLSGKDRTAAVEPKSNGKEPKSPSVPARPAGVDRPAIKPDEPATNSPEPAPNKGHPQQPSSSSPNEPPEEPAVRPPSPNEPDKPPPDVPAPNDPRQPVPLPATEAAPGEPTTEPISIGPRKVVDDKRTTVPTGELLIAARKKADEVFAADRAAASTVEEKQLLGRTILAKALEITSRPADQYALLVLAEEVAVAAGDPTLAMEVDDALERAFAVDGWTIKLAALSRMSKHAAGAAAWQNIASTAMHMAPEAATIERYDAAGDLAKLALDVGTRMRNGETMRQASALRREVADREKSLQAAVRAYERWKVDPADADALLALGKYLCFTKGDWARGLPMLRQSRETKLHDVANLELAGSASATQQLAIADAWWDAGEKLPPLRTPARLRARHWYETVLPSLEGLDKARAEKRLAVLESALRGDAGATAGTTMRIELAKDVAMVFRRIPAGQFLMGSPADDPARKRDESPHLVTISKPFFLGVTEVTQAQWMAVMRQNPSSQQTGDKNLPVENVDWDQCQQLCSALSQSAAGTKCRFRLPTEAEWEYACRAGTRTASFFGADPRLVAKFDWTEQNSHSRTQPVGQLKPNPWGLYDMYGNVAEWCADFYGPYVSSAQTDPVGPRTGTKRVQRGGSALEFDVRSASRDSNPASDRRGYLGVRLLAEPR